MTKTNFKQVIETNAEGLKISQIESKDVDVKKPDGTVEKVKYKKVKFTFEHPNDDGSSTRGKADFSLPQMDHPRGIKMDNGKLSAFTVFDTSNEDVNLLVTDKTLTQSRGWVPSENIKIITKGGKTFAKASRNIELYSGPNEKDEVVASFDKGELMNVEDQNEEDTWYLVAAGGKDGFFSVMRNKIADLIIEDKVRAGLGAVSDEDIRRTVKQAIYWPLDKEGKLVQGKSPSSYLKVSYFQARPKEGKKEGYAKYYVPGMGDLDLETMTKSALKLNSVVVKLIDVYVGAGKIVPSYYISSAVVVDISEIKMYNELEDELAEQSKDEQLVAKLKKQLADSKKFEAPVIKSNNANSDKNEAIKSLESNNDEGGDADDISDLLDNGPKEVKKKDVKTSLKTNISIPGIPDGDD